MTKKYKRPDSVNIWVEHFSEMGRAELGVIMKQYTQDSEKHHAAAIIIDEIDKRNADKEDKKHQNLITISRLTLLVSTIVAIAAVFAAVFAKTQAESSLQSAQFAAQHQMPPQQQIEQQQKKIPIGNLPK